MDDPRPDDPPTPDRAKAHDTYAYSVGYVEGLQDGQKSHKRQSGRNSTEIAQLATALVLLIFALVMLRAALARAEREGADNG